MRRTVSVLLALLLCLSLGGCIQVHVHMPGEGQPGSLGVEFGSSEGDSPASGAEIETQSESAAEPPVSSELSQSGEEDGHAQEKPERQEDEELSSESEAPTDVVDPTTIPYDATYSQEGDYRAKQHLNRVTIRTGGVTLRNKTIHKDVRVTAETGVVLLQDMTVAGSVIVEGGAEVILRNVTAQAVTVRSAQYARVTLEGATAVERTDVYTDSILTSRGATGRGWVKVRTCRGAGMVTIGLTLQDAFVRELEVVESVTLSLRGAAEVFHFTGDDDRVYYE